MGWRRRETREKEKNTFHLMVFSQNTHKSRTGKSQESKTYSESPTRMVGIDLLEPSPAATQTLYQQEAGIEREEVKPIILIWTWHPR